MKIFISCLFVFFYVSLALSQEIDSDASDTDCVNDKRMQVFRDLFGPDKNVTPKCKMNKRIQVEIKLDMESSLAIISYDQLNETRVRVFYDQKKKIIAYKDVANRRCLLEKVTDDNKPMIYRIGESGEESSSRDNWNTSKTLYFSPRAVQKRARVKKFAGKKILTFCDRLRISFLKSAFQLTNDLPGEAKKREKRIRKPKPQGEEKNIHEEFLKWKKKNKKSEQTEGRVKRQIRNRFRGQTQTQFMSFGADGKGNAEAVAQPEISKTSISGVNGIGQAQSQSGGFDCDECYPDGKSGRGQSDFRRGFRLNGQGGEGGQVGGGIGGAQGVAGPGGIQSGSYPGGTQGRIGPGGSQTGGIPGGVQNGGGTGGIQGSGVPGGVQGESYPGIRGTQGGIGPGGSQTGSFPGGIQPGETSGSRDQGGVKPGGTFTNGGGIGGSFPGGVDSSRTGSGHGTGNGIGGLPKQNGGVHGIPGQAGRPGLTNGVGGQVGGQTGAYPPSASSKPLYPGTQHIPGKNGQYPGKINGIPHSQGPTQTGQYPPSASSKPLYPPSGGGGGGQFGQPVGGHGQSSGSNGKVPFYPPSASSKPYYPSVGGSHIGSRNGHIPAGAGQYPPSASSKPLHPSSSNGHIPARAGQYPPSASSKPLHPSSGNGHIPAGTGQYPPSASSKPLRPAASNGQYPPSASSKPVHPSAGHGQYPPSASSKPLQPSSGGTQNGHSQIGGRPIAGGTPGYFPPSSSSKLYPTGQYVPGRNGQAGTRPSPQYPPSASSSRNGPFPPSSSGSSYHPGRLPPSASSKPLYPPQGPNQYGAHGGTQVPNGRGHASLFPPSAGSKPVDPSAGSQHAGTGYYPPSSGSYPGRYPPSAFSKQPQPFYPSVQPQYQPQQPSNGIGGSQAIPSQHGLQEIPCEPEVPGGVGSQGYPGSHLQIPSGSHTVPGYQTHTVHPGSGTGHHGGVGVNGHQYPPSKNGGSYPTIYPEGSGVPDHHGIGHPGSTGTHQQPYPSASGGQYPSIHPSAGGSGHPVLQPAPNGHAGGLSPGYPIQQPSGGGHSGLYPAGPSPGSVGHSGVHPGTPGSDHGIQGGHPGVHPGTTGSGYGIGGGHPGVHPGTTGTGHGIGGGHPGLHPGLGSQGHPSMHLGPSGTGTGGQIGAAHNGHAQPGHVGGTNGVHIPSGSHIGGTYPGGQGSQPGEGTTTYPGAGTPSGPLPGIGQNGVGYPGGQIGQPGGLGPGRSENRPGSGTPGIQEGYPGGPVGGGGLGPGVGTGTGEGLGPGAGGGLPSTTGGTGGLPGAAGSGYPGQDSTSGGSIPSGVGAGGVQGRPGGVEGTDTALQCTPGTECKDNEESQVQTSVTQDGNATRALSSAQGRFGKGITQAQVSGTYSGSGSFSAQAQTSDNDKGAQVQVIGGSQGASSAAQGMGGRGQTQAQVQLGSQNGATTAEAQSIGFNFGTNTQVKAGEKGGLADAQADGPGSTSSQAQIGFTPHKKKSEKDKDQKVPFQGGVSASAQSGTNVGQSQTSLFGSFLEGISYTGSSQAASGASLSKLKSKNSTVNNGTENEKQSMTQFPNKLGLPALPKLGGGILKDLDFNFEQKVDTETGESKKTPETGEIPDLTETEKTSTTTSKPKTGGGYTKPQSNPKVDKDAEILENENDDENDEDYEEEEEEYDENAELQAQKPIKYKTGEGVQTKYGTVVEKNRSFTVGQKSPTQSQTVFIGGVDKKHDVHIEQDADEQVKEGDVLEPGQRILGPNGYTIPNGYRGRVTSVAGQIGKTRAQASNGGHAQSQTVLVQPGTGKVHYSNPRSYQGQQLKSAPLVEKHYNIDHNDDYQISEKPDTFVTITKSITGQLGDDKPAQAPYPNLVSGAGQRKYSHTYYTKSSTCGYFTFSCNVVFGSNGRAKICKPNPPTNPDGSPCVI